MTIQYQSHLCHVLLALCSTVLDFDRATVRPRSGRRKVDGAQKSPDLNPGFLLPLM